MLQQFLQDFGYFALFLGTFFEGETILVLAGFLAFRGYMDINMVVLVAFFGSYAGDQLWYFMGRRHGRKLLARKPRWQASVTVISGHYDEQMTVVVCPASRSRIPLSV